VARIHPQRTAFSLSNAEIEKLVENMKNVLKEAIKLRGTTISDYRDAEGNEGEFQNFLKVYGKENAPCPNNCGSLIKQVKMKGRKTYFCEKCQ
jgi:formamidopyrimidine-DNA glycosylase